MATATAAGTVTYAVLTTEQRVFYELNMLERAIPNFLHLWFGMEGSMFPVSILPENKGHQIQWNKLSAFTAVTTALVEGVTPDPEDITISTVTGTVAEYGAYVRYTRSLAQMGIHKVAAEASDALGAQAGESLDLITRAAVIASGTAQYANNRANEASIVNGDNLTFQEIMEAVTTLKSANATPLMGSSYACILHPKSVYDLYVDPVFQSVLSYAKERGEANPWMRGFIGSAFGVDFYETANGYSLSNGTVDVYYTHILGKGAYGIGGLGAYMPQVIREERDTLAPNHTYEDIRPLRLIDKPFGSTGTADPFDRLASIAWFTTFVATVLDANFYIRLLHDVNL